MFQEHENTRTFREYQSNQDGTWWTTFGVAALDVTSKAPLDGTNTMDGNLYKEMDINVVSCTWRATYIGLMVRP